MLQIHIRLEISPVRRNFLCVDDLRKFKMVDESNSDDVARCLNSLTLNMRNIASKDVLCELVNDYFITRPIASGEDDSDLSETKLSCDEVESEGAIEHLADVIMPHGNGDAVETEPEFQLNCSCKLSNGQPCHGRYATDEIADVRLQFLGMTRDKLDIAILAKLSCGMHLSKMTTGSRRRQ